MPSLPVVIPLIVAAILAGSASFIGRRALDVIAVAASAAVFAVNVCLMVSSAKAPLVYWFGGWQPDVNGHFPVGICFMVDPFGAGLAALVSLLVLMAFLFSWSYFRSLRSLYHALVLVFLAAMCGLCLTGDLFNLFVWFELMTAAAVALCGYESGESQPLQGALNFAVTNTIGAFLTFLGIGFIYAFTGSLNMAEVGRTLSEHTPNAAFVSLSFVLIIAGFLVKSAPFPFHFWLADAHAVAPTPICILFSGVMVELGLYGVVRIYWLVFAGLPPPMVGNIRGVFLLIGSLTAVIGALFSYGQRHLKRLLAFSTISHMGLMFLGFALLDSHSLAGVALYVLGHGLIKASLFIGAGILLHRFNSMDEYDLSHRGRGIKSVGFMMLAGAWGLAGLPPFATYFGQDQMERVATGEHKLWLLAIAIFTEAITAAAVLRFTSRVFFGVGSGRSLAAEGSPHIAMEPETRGPHTWVPATMWLPMAITLIMAACIAFPLRQATQHFAAQFENPAVYRAAVLQDQSVSSAISSMAGRVLENPQSENSSSMWWTRLVVVVVAVVVAALGLFPKPKTHLAPRFLLTFLKGPLFYFRRFQSGRVGDYVAWLIFGIALYGTLLLKR